MRVCSSCCLFPGFAAYTPQSLYEYRTFINILNVKFNVFEKISVKKNGLVVCWVTTKKQIDHLNETERYGNRA